MPKGGKCILADYVALATKFFQPLDRLGRDIKGCLKVYHTNKMMMSVCVGGVRKT